jgi:hypothetical protein
MGLELPEGAFTELRPLRELPKPPLKGLLLEPATEFDELLLPLLYPLLAWEFAPLLGAAKAGAALLSLSGATVAGFEALAGLLSRLKPRNPTNRPITAVTPKAAAIWPLL